MFRKINKMFLFVCVASLSLGIFIHANQEMIIKILFMRGNFDINSLNLVVSLLQYYSIGFCFYSINTFMFRIYNAEMRNKELSIIVIGAHIITFFLLFTLYFLKIKVDEIVGISYIIVNLLQTIALKVRSQSLSIRYCVSSFQGKLTVVIACVIFALLIGSKQYISSSILYFFTSSILLVLIFGVSLNYIRKNEGEI
ncbi:lipid II flippase MurJ [Priestia megaterium]|uniref:lipid II flippase MurJ n=1 Tax=Priestia megaterium TaxID=1404 RepID=UPI003990A8DB